MDKLKGKKEKEHSNTDMITTNDILLMNSTAVEAISQNKVDIAFKLLKQAEVELETLALESMINIDKKIIMVVLHNVACCHQKIKDFTSCITYLDAILFHFDGVIETKFNQKATGDGFLNLGVNNEKNLNSHKDFSDFILMLRFSSKFHLQMCAVYSQNGNHVDAIAQSKISAKISEDNFMRTLALLTDKKSAKTKSNTEVLDYYNLEECLTLLNENIKSLQESITGIETETSNSFSTKSSKVQSLSSFSSSKSSIRESIRRVFKITDQSDWIFHLNIGNIMFMTPLNFEDLNLESEGESELVRDALIEKIVMLIVSYFCVSTEIRFNLEENDLKDQQSAKERRISECYLNMAIEISSLFLPLDCPINKHLLSSYKRNFSYNLPCIMEDCVLVTEIDSIRKDTYSNLYTNDAKSNSTLLFRVKVVDIYMFEKQQKALEKLENELYPNLKVNKKALDLLTKKPDQSPSISLKTQLKPPAQEIKLRDELEVKVSDKKTLENIDFTSQLIEYPVLKKSSSLKPGLEKLKLNKTHNTDESNDEENFRNLDFFRKKFSSKTPQCKKKMLSPNQFDKSTSQLNTKKILLNDITKIKTIQNDSNSLKLTTSPFFKQKTLLDLNLINRSSAAAVAERGVNTFRFEGTLYNLMKKDAFKDSFPKIKIRNNNGGLNDKSEAPTTEFDNGMSKKKVQEKLEEDSLKDIKNPKASNTVSLDTKKKTPIENGIGSHTTREKTVKLDLLNSIRHLQLKKLTFKQNLVAKVSNLR